MTQSDGYWLKEPICYICGRKRSACIAMRDKEIRNRIPDPHEFESADDADRRASYRQIDARERTKVMAAEASRIPSRDEPYLPPDLAAETQARLEADQPEQENA
jgi:hypothetical protein